MKPHLDGFNSGEEKLEMEMELEMEEREEGERRESEDDGFLPLGLAAAGGWKKQKESLGRN